MAIVGAGFAGISVAAGLIKKGANVVMTIFEQRDTLIPLQQGSDSRWLHPRIYDWPSDGSEAGAAMLPVLNWTAARASDVVVQVLTEWKRIVDEHRPVLSLYCNARHMQIEESASGKIRIEWVGELREGGTGTSLDGNAATALGLSDDFDLVILAVGFGLENETSQSYWRNETFAQPSLGRPRQAYLVSGQGDGAMIDLLRLRITQYRQDRILDELFGAKPLLLDAIKKLHAKYGQDHRSGLFDALEKLVCNKRVGVQTRRLLLDLAKRLRRDTEVILHLEVRKISELFDSPKSKISFQNRLMVYFLYKCGGFIPSCAKEELLVEEYSIDQDHIIRRHGTDADKALKEFLSKSLYESLSSYRSKEGSNGLKQSDKEIWAGGYFGYPGSSKSLARFRDTVKGHWRKEYLPGPTELLATAFCAGLAGAIRQIHPKPGRLRVTLHRAVVFGNKEVLQQSCGYLGSEDLQSAFAAAARTFPARNATIGLAYDSRRTVRSRRGVSAKQLKDASNYLNLNAASRAMQKNVRFVLAIPILEPQESGGFRDPNPVAGVIYIDSTANDFFIEDNELASIVSMTNHFLNYLEQGSGDAFDRIRNVPISGLGNQVPNAGQIPQPVKSVFQLVSKVDPPATEGPFQFNFEYSDFVPVREYI